MSESIQSRTAFLPPDNTVSSPGGPSARSNGFDPDEPAGLTESDDKEKTKAVNDKSPATNDAPATEPLFSETRESGPGQPEDKGAVADELNLLGVIPVTLSLQVGKKEMLVSEIIKLKPGAIIQFDQRESDPLDICVNGTLIARGEVVLIGERYGLRVLEIL